MSREEGARPATAQSVDVSACLLAQAEASFERGDMQQASGKAWGAVAECVESASKENGWRNQSDRGISSSAGKLLDLTPDPKGNRRKFAVIDFLRVNYFDYELDPEDVARALRDARALVEAVRGSGADARPRARHELRPSGTGSRGALPGRRRMPARPGRDGVRERRRGAGLREDVGRRGALRGVGLQGEGLAQRVGRRRSEGRQKATGPDFRSQGQPCQVGHLELPPRQLLRRRASPRGRRARH